MAFKTTRDLLAVLGRIHICDRHHSNILGGRRNGSRSKQVIPNWKVKAFYKIKAKVMGHYTMQGNKELLDQFIGDKWDDLLFKTEDEQLDYLVYVMNCLEDEEKKRWIRGLMEYTEEIIIDRFIAEIRGNELSQM